MAMPRVSQAQTLALAVTCHAVMCLKQAKTFNRVFACSSIHIHQNEHLYNLHEARETANASKRTRRSISSVRSSHAPASSRAAYFCPVPGSAATALLVSAEASGNAASTASGAPLPTQLRTQLPHPRRTRAGAACVLTTPTPEPCTQRSCPSCRTLHGSKTALLTNEPFTPKTPSHPNHAACSAHCCACSTRVLQAKTGYRRNSTFPQGYQLDEHL